MGKIYAFELSLKGPCDTLVGLTTSKEEVENVLSKIPNRRAHISMRFKFHGDREEIQRVVTELFK